MGCYVCDGSIQVTKEGKRMRHLSDCAVHNSPAAEVGQCDCMEDQYNILCDKHLELSIKYADLADKYVKLKLVS